MKYELVPIIPITISYKSNEMTVEALIDSGASFCFCPIEIAKELAIPLERCPVVKLTGVGGTVSVHLHKLNVNLEFGRVIIPSDVGFGKFSFHGFSFVLGQRDFFEKIDILFLRRKGKIELHLP